MSKENIPFIHNYCDQWCDRCVFTTQCAVFQSEKQTPTEVLDRKNKIFWERLSQNFAKAKNLLEEAAKKSGLDLAAVELEMAESEKRELDLRKKSKAHAASQLSLEYSDLTQRWLKTQPGMLDKLEALKQDLTLGVESQQNAKDQIETIRESLSVVEWYSTFLHVKIVRALMSKAGREISGDDESKVQCDDNGSAKIALIGIERSMQAWANLFDLLPEQEDHFLIILSMLEKTKTALSTEFPHAMEFIRPGFDETAP